MPNCYYYDQQGNCCKCYDNEALDELLAENAKLRELVTKAHACKTDEGCCEGCYQDKGCCSIEREMQELGIEVDG